MTVHQKVALVTGAASGIGEATADALVAAGAWVYLADVDDDGVAAVAERLAGKTEGVHLDVADADSWATAVHDVTSRSGPISVLVNNAGIFTPGGVEALGTAEFQRTFDVNALGVFLGMRSVAESMKSAGGGSIVNVSSSAGLVGVKDAIAYWASKWAVRGLTRSAALDLAPYSIRVNSVHEDREGDEDEADDDHRRREAEPVLAGGLHELGDRGQEAVWRQVTAPDAAA